MADIEKYNNRLNEIEQLQHQKRNQLKERAIRRNLEIVKKQIFVTEQQRKYEKIYPNNPLQQSTLISFTKLFHRQQISLRRQIIAQDKAMQAKMVKKFNNQPETFDFVVKCPVEV